MKRRIIAMLIVMIVVLAVVLQMGKYECSSSQSTTNFKEHLTISIAYWQIADYFPAGKKDKITERLEKQFNITIKPVAVAWNDYTEKYKVWAATGQLPDIFAHEGIGTKDFWKWKDQGVIKPLPKDLSPYPNLKKYLSDEDGKFFMINGRYWAIPRKNSSDPIKYEDTWCIYMHKDIYQSLGFKNPPKTVNELASMLRLIKNKYPNIVPLTSHNLVRMFGIVRNYNPAMITGWVYENGKWIPGFFSDKTLAAIKAMKPLFDEGLIDRDFAINANTFNGRDKFILKKAAAIINGISPANFVNYNMQWQKAYPGQNIMDHIVVLPLPADGKGKYYIARGTNFWSESYISSNVDDKKMDRILRLYDYLLSQDGSMLRHFGLKDIDYRIEKGNIIITRKKDSTGNYLPLNQIYPSMGIWQQLVTWDADFIFNDPSLDPKIKKVTWNFINWKLKTFNIYPNFNAYIGLISTPLKDKFVYNVNYDDLVQLLMTKTSVDKAWIQLKEKYEKQGLSKMIEEVNKEAKKMGLIK